MSDPRKTHEFTWRRFGVWLPTLGMCSWKRLGPQIFVSVSFNYLPNQTSVQARVCGFTLLQQVLHFRRGIYEACALSRGERPLRQPSLHFSSQEYTRTQQLGLGNESRAHSFACEGGKFRPWPDWLAFSDARDIQANG